jgi:hypothetical protein
MSDPIIVVAGFGRCGTTLMMHMLRAGGVPVLSDTLDGGLECHRVFDLPGNHSWLAEAAGSALKVLEPHQNPVPAEYDARFIFLVRNHREQARSQLKMIRECFPSIAMDRFALDKTERSLRDSQAAMLRSAGARPWMTLRFERLLAEPLASAQEVAAFIGRPFDVDAAAAVVFPRTPECQPGFDIEARLVGESPRTFSITH